MAYIGRIVFGRYIFILYILYAVIIEGCRIDQNPLKVQLLDPQHHGKSQVNNQELSQLQTGHRSTIQETQHTTSQ